MSFRYFVVALVCALFVVKSTGIVAYAEQQAADIQCSHGILDLSPLRLKERGDRYIAFGGGPENSKYEYVFNICAGVPDCHGAPACQWETSDEGKKKVWDTGSLSGASIADLDAEDLRHVHETSKSGIVYESGVKLIYPNGEGGRKTIIYMPCRTDLTGEARTAMVEDPKEVYKITFPTQYACPPGSLTYGGRPSLGFGWNIFILIIVFSSVYCIGGVAYNRLQMGASGIELIPNLTFWISFFGFFQNGVSFIKGKIVKTNDGTVGNDGL